MRHLRLSVLSVLSAALLGGPAVPLRVPSPRHDMVVKHKWDVIPDDWLSVGPPPDDNTIELHIALQPEHKDALTDALHEVSQPRHPKYGAHLSKEQVAELVAPYPDTLELVTSWLEYNGVPPSSVSMTHGGGWLTVADVPVSQANELLGASYQFYYHAGRNDTILRTVGYALPAALHVHVKTVIPTTAFTFTRPLQQTPPRRSGEAAVLNATSGEPVNMPSRRPQPEWAVEPSVLRSLYKIATYVPPVAADSRLGIVGYDYEYPDLDDQEPFRYLLASDLNEKPETVTFESINPNAPAGYKSNQANLFAEYTSALTYPLPITFYKGNGVRLMSHGSHKIVPGANDAIEQWLKYATDREDNPHTIGLISEGLRERNLPLEYMDAVCELFKRLGTRGTSVLVPSGDQGVGNGVTAKFCLNFPASCPSVTSVGGTTGIPEVASLISGGGFSYHFQAEDYRANVVNAFVLSLGDMYSGRYVSWGRGVPDISAQSLKYKYVYKLRDNQMDSTLCSTSTAVAIFSLLNDYRIFHGFEPLGFLNPWLYGVGSMGFNDIKKGNNPGGRTKGFFAIEGWDSVRPITGLGTPDFSELLELNNPILLRLVQGPDRRNGSFHDQP